MRKIIIKEEIAKEIPIRSIFPEKAENIPLVFYIHGYGGDKDQALDYCYALAKQGFYVVSFDCHDHGLRDVRSAEHSSRIFTIKYPTDSGIDTYTHMHEVIAKTGRDVEMLTEHFINLKEVDTNRIGLSGFSMGGFATFYIAANNPAIKVAVPIGGKPSFKKAWEDTILSTSTYDQWSSELERLVEETEKRTAFMEEIDPFEKMIEFCPKPLLIINGDKDTDSFYLYSIELYKYLKQYYAANPDQLKLSMPFVDHKLTSEIEELACKWFKTYL